MIIIEFKISGIAEFVLSRKESSCVIDYTDKISSSVFAKRISKNVEVLVIERERAADVMRIVKPVSVIYIVNDLETGYRWWVDGMLVAMGAHWSLLC